MHEVDGPVGNTHYFAYGSNLDMSQMAIRCPSAVCLGQASLHGYRFTIMSRGYATIIPETGASVHGLLWSLSRQDEASLDRYESVAQGNYRKETIEILTADGIHMTVMTYLAREKECGLPKAGYLERIVRAAESIPLPLEYIVELRSWSAPNHSGATQRASLC